MKPDKRDLLLPFAFLLLVWLAFMGLGILFYAPGVTAQSGTTIPDRLDFTATEGQAAFPTAPVFPRLVVVYKNGLLQRGCATCDYTQAPIQGGARIRVTFNPTPDTLPVAGD